MKKGLILISHSEKRVLWNERIKEFLASGQSRQAWCRDNGVSVQQLGYWLRKIQPSQTNQDEGGRWVSMDTAPTVGSGIILRIGAVSLEIQRGFDSRVLTDVVLSLITLC